MIPTSSNPAKARSHAASGSRASRTARLVGSTRPRRTFTNPLLRAQRNTRSTPGVSVPPGGGERPVPDLFVDGIAGAEQREEVPCVGQVRGARTVAPGVAEQRVAPRELIKQGLRCTVRILGVRALTVGIQQLPIVGEADRVMHRDGASRRTPAAAAGPVPEPERHRPAGAPPSGAASGRIR